MTTMYNLMAVLIYRENGVGLDMNLFNLFCAVMSTVYDLTAVLIHCENGVGLNMNLFKLV